MIPHLVAPRAASDEELTVAEAGLLARSILERLEPSGSAGAFTRRPGFRRGTNGRDVPFDPAADSPLTIRLGPAQADAVSRASVCIHRHGGVLLADRTGTGKTYLALALIELALTCGSRRVLVTGPAGLAPQWLPLLRRSASAHGARILSRRSVHDPNAALSQSDGEPDAPPAIAWLSHTLISLGRWPRVLDPPDLVVVDEAHAFRNPATRRHRALCWLCRRARVVLLTATPINNSLMDLYFLMRIFVGDGAMGALGVPDLGGAFRAAIASGGRIRPPLDAAIDAITVRSRPVSRTPGDGARLRHRNAHAGQAAQPRRVVPVSVRYDLDAGADGLVASVLEAVRRLELLPHGIGGSIAAAPSAELIRFALIKRLESSRVAFERSAAGLCRFLSAFADAATDGYWLRPSAHAAFAGRTGQLLLTPLALPRLPAGADAGTLVASARSDVALLRGALDRLNDRLGRRDPKAERLVELLAGDLADRKVLVFSEYRDTTICLWRRLRDRRPTGLIHGGEARLGAQAASRREVVVRFAPIANGATPGIGEEIDLLVATDLLAEGFNLQDAAHVVSYDLPWNPVRLIQRVGRIDRAGSVHRRVVCYNFMPDRTLDNFLGLMDRIGEKIEIIRAGPGREALDRGIGRFDGRCGARSALQRPFRNVGAARRTLPRQPGTGAGAVLTVLLRRLGTAEPGLFDEFEAAADPIAGLGLGERIGSSEVDRPSPGNGDSAGTAEAAGWLVVIESDGEIQLLTVRPGDGRPIVRRDVRRAIGILRRIESGRLQVHAFAPGSVALLPGRSAGSRPVDIARGGAVWRATAAALAAFGELGRPSAGSGGTVRLIRDLLRIVAAEPGGADASILDRADAVVARLRRGVRSGAEAAAAALIRSGRADSAAGPAGRAARLVGALESLLAADPIPGGDRPSGTRLIGVFEL